MWRQLLVKVLCKQITLGKYLDFFMDQLVFQKETNLLTPYIWNSLKIFRPLNSIALIDRTKA